MSALARNPVLFGAFTLAAWYLAALDPTAGAGAVFFWGWWGWAAFVKKKDSSKQ